MDPFKRKAMKSDMDRKSGHSINNIIESHARVNVEHKRRAVEEAPKEDLQFNSFAQQQHNTTPHVVIVNETLLLHAHPI